MHSSHGMLQHDLKIPVYQAANLREADFIRSCILHMRDSKRKVEIEALRFCNNQDQPAYREQKRGDEPWLVGGVRAFEASCSPRGDGGDTEASSCFGALFCAVGNGSGSACMLGCHRVREPYLADNNWAYLVRFVAKALSAAYQ
jgi:hypothetical protein